MLRPAARLLARCLTAAKNASRSATQLTRDCTKSTTSCVVRLEVEYDDEDVGDSSKPPPPPPPPVHGAGHYECPHERHSVAALLADCAPFEWVVVRGSGSAAAVTAAIAAVTAARPLLASYGPKAADKHLLDAEAVT